MMALALFMPHHGMLGTRACYVSSRSKAGGALFDRGETQGELAIN